MTEEKNITNRIQTTLLPNDDVDDEKITGQAIEDETELKRAIDAVLFAAGYPLTHKRLSAVFSRDLRDMKRIIASHTEEFNQLGLGIMMLDFDDSVQLCTREEYKNHIREALGIKLSGKLSNSSLEVLAIVAYHQPCTKAFIEKVRGVDCAYAISSLCDKGLIESVDRLEVPGRPLLYSTTDSFLRCFGINSLSELPKISSADPDGNENADKLEIEFRD